MDTTLIVFLSVFGGFLVGLICFGLYLCVYHTDPEKEKERDRKRRLESEKLRRKIASKYSLVHVKNPISNVHVKNNLTSKVEPDKRFINES